MPRKTIFKIGLATAAAGVAAIMAITSAFAHGTPTTYGRSIVANIVNTAAGAGMVSNDSIASTTISDEQDQDAIEAAELAAKIAAEQALAAKLAAEEAAEAAATTCASTDATEDSGEKAADQSEDSAERSNATESATEDSSEKAAQQATDKTEDGSEVKCASAEVDQHSGGDSKEATTKTFSSEGDH